MPKSLTPTQITRLLKFKKDWITDPAPEYRKYLNADVLKQIAQAKVVFGKEIDQIVTTGLIKR